MFDEMIGDMNYGRYQVVAHFKNGGVLKGYTQDFTPPRRTFNIAAAKNVDDITEVDTANLKALFFVRSLEGDKEYVEKNTFEGVDVLDLDGVRIKVEFPDGEVLRGTTSDYKNIFKGFFVTPIDPKGNNERVYVEAYPELHISIGTKADE